MLECHNRMRAPEVSEAFTVWAEEMAAAKRVQEAAQLAEREESMQSKQQELQQRLDTIRDEYKQQLAAAEEKHLADLERLRSELTGTAEEQAAAREARAREERIEL